MMPTHRVEVFHDSQVGNARRLVHQAALRLGGDEIQAGRAAIVASELATNLVKHARGGEILFREVRHGGNCSLELHALDRGPGMADVAVCLRDGYSTAGTAGIGLGVVQRRSEQFQIYSQPGGGTVVWLRFRVTGTAPSGGHFSHGGISVAQKGQEFCGDAWIIRESSKGLRVLLADGVGHGPLAATAAMGAVAVFAQHESLSPPECLAIIHQALLRTVGSAVAGVDINWIPKSIRAAGAGNVAVNLLRPSYLRTFEEGTGVLGGTLCRIKDARDSWDLESVLVLHTDGIGSRWDLEKYPGLLGSHPALIAGVLYRDFRKSYDDSSVVVVRQLSEPGFRVIPDRQSGFAASA